MPASTQASRSGLITATIVMAFLFVLSAVFAIYFYANASKVSKERDTLRTQYGEVIDQAALGGSDIAALESARTSAEQFNGYGGTVNSQSKLFDVALGQRNYLASLIATGSTEQAINAAKAAAVQAADAAKQSNAKLPGTSLVDVIHGLSTVVAASQSEVDALNKQLDDANDKLKTQAATSQALVDKFTQDVQAAQKETTAASDRADQLSSDQQKKVQELQSQLDTTLKSSQEAQQKLQGQITEISRKNNDAQKQLNDLRIKLAALRPDPNGPILRQADGHIVRVVPNGSTVFIDRGAGEQMSEGLTFEVFDKNEGIPPPGDPNTNDNLPKGKGSIEVVRVGPSSSECRIINQQPGQSIAEGDLICNLVYDVNTKYRFFVYGNFDLAHTGKPTPADAVAIKRLITQWGGMVVNDITADTDFVVLGAEPVINAYTKDDLEDPLIKAKYQAEQQGAAAYDDIRGKALDYKIPILNQNRFLYLVGYYELASQIDTR
jgi:uncharacterized membrane-anchored protein YhcB (DUF1043 family)